MNGPNGTIPEHLYLSDFVTYLHSPRQIPSQVFAAFSQKGLTASQIGALTGFSKQAVLARLRKEGIRRMPGHGRRPDNYRYPNPPFGFRLAEGRLIVSRSEMKTVRLIVNLRNKSLGWEAIAAHLNQSQLPSRTGKNWDRARVRRVFRRWNKKI